MIKKYNNWGDNLYLSGKSVDGSDCNLTEENEDDIKCTSEDCPNAETCLRRTKQSIANQEWDDLSYECNINVGYNFYIENEKI